MKNILVFLFIITISWAGISISNYSAASRVNKTNISDFAHRLDDAGITGEKSIWNGYERHDFTYDTRRCIVVVPKNPAGHLPWIWRARFFGHEPQTDLKLLEKGFHLVYMDVADLLVLHRLLITGIPFTIT